MSNHSEGRNTSGMSDQHPNQSHDARNSDPTPAPDPSLMQHIERVATTFCKAKVDLSWLRDYDLDDIDALGGFVAHKSMQFCGEYCSNEADGAAYVTGIMNSVSTIMAAYRSNASEDDFLANLVIMLSQYCYETGVRDAHEGRLSGQCQDAIAQWVNKKDEYFDHMRALYDDIR